MITRLSDIGGASVKLAELPSLTNSRWRRDLGSKQGVWNHNNLIWHVYNVLHNVYRKNGEQFFTLRSQNIHLKIKIKLHIDEALESKYIDIDKNMNPEINKFRRNQSKQKRIKQINMGHDDVIDYLIWRNCSSFVCIW